MSRLFEDPDDMLCDLARFRPHSGVEGRLAAAGLVAWKFHLHARALENVDHGFADFREEAIHKTGDEKLNSTHGFILTRIPIPPSPIY